MVEFVRALQQNIMLSLSGVSCVMVILLLMTKVLSPKRKWILTALEFSTFCILVFERQAYHYVGEAGTLADVMIRVSNFIVFLLNTTIGLIFNFYVEDLLKEDCGVVASKRINAVKVLSLTSIAILVLNLFNGWIYTIDAGNVYHREALFYLNYILAFSGPVIDLTVVVQYRKQLSKKIFKSVLMFIITPICAGLIQSVVYGLSLINMSLAVVAVFLYVFAYDDINDKIAHAKQTEYDVLQKDHAKMRNLFDQTIKAFANAIDSRIDYSEGHSVRVADYAVKLAQMNGKSEEECKDIYTVALLHDVGKIGIPDSILKKEGALTEEETEIIRNEPFIGERILSAITEYPNLGVGARYHKERYDGSGYPKGIKGNKIPESARIIAIAEAYDLMTTRTAEREPLPQSFVREEFIKGSGNKYDPLYTGCMLQMIDSDVDYHMKEETENVDTIIKKEFICDEYRSVISYGIRIRPEKKIIKFISKPVSDEKEFSDPSVIIFDSLDERVHDNEYTIRETRYSEFGELWFDGHFVCSDARNMKMISLEKIEGDDDGKYEIEAARNTDHVLIRMKGKGFRSETIIALPDNSNYSYIGLTGENCHISSIEIEKTEEAVSEKDIPRIAEEINYINRLESDVPNVQIDGIRSDYTQGVKVEDGLRLIFHTMSLPSSNLIWHCPYILLYYSDDKNVYGKGYKEYAMIRFDGETQDGGGDAVNKIETVKDDNFVNWDKWKKRNKKGYESTVTFRIGKNKIITESSNCGISIRNVTTMLDKNKTVYAAITGDLVAITDIRVRK